jgi:hypothetical protein
MTRDVDGDTVDGVTDEFPRWWPLRAWLMPRWPATGRRAMNGSSQHFYPESGYLGSSFDHHRAMWATVVALACGAVGAGVGALALIGGQEFDFPAPRATVEPGYAELSHDFAALQAAVRPGIGNPTAGAGNGGASNPAEAVAAPSDAAGAASAAASGAAKCCPQATWPFFDKDCLWGGTAGFGQDDRPRRRIVPRLRSPWCSGLRSNEGAYICRSRT